MSIREILDFIRGLFGHEQTATKIAAPLFKMKDDLAAHIEKQERKIAKKEELKRRLNELIDQKSADIDEAEAIITSLNNILPQKK